MTVKLELPLSPKQLRSVQDADARVNVWEGSVRSGKTVASLLRWLVYVATSKVRGELVAVSRTRGSAARNIFAPLMSPDLFGDVAKHVSYTPGADTATVLGRKVWVLGSSDIRSEQVLRGLTCAGAYVDEITLLQEDFFVQLLNRLWEGAKFFGTTNPGNPAHWLKRKFLDRITDLPDWRSWHFLLDDNPLLSEERKDAIRRENIGLYYRRNVLGEWVAAEGAVFPQWDPARHTIPWATLPVMQRLLGVGVDYGTTNPSSGVLLGLGVDQRLYAVDEWRHDPAVSQIRLTDAELSTSFRAWLSAAHTPDVTDLVPQWVAIDPAAASFKVQLFNDKVRGLTDAENDVAYGIQTMSSLLGAEQLLITDRCAGLITELPGYSWDDKATEKGEDKPLKTADHSIDAARYAVATTESLWRGRLTTTPREAA
ncbi:PBSX family phage terminase large subunit [Jatrophihabitans sp. GAS493]|uniref:PBSX family phage terminase large subunit n=1 Tax=Jatrophihabitans sp. GAS493 TaxID=1907575 RepID=UPI000BB97D22|nr:terminase family protein [Jatrophihabitans sp. GAS493]SOD72730.1 PBSX family phage terminase large subunit [Jatrophihabitans sp. GAS493]